MYWCGYKYFFLGTIHIINVAAIALVISAVIMTYHLTAANHTPMGLQQEIYIIPLIFSLATMITSIVGCYFKSNRIIILAIALALVGSILSILGINLGLVVAGLGGTDLFHFGEYRSCPAKTTCTGPLLLITGFALLFISQVLYVIGIYQMRRYIFRVNSGIYLSVH